MYVAETGDGGGTWSGAIEGLKAKQDVYVRYAEPEEKCANNKVIALGAKPVDMGGNLVNAVDIPLEGEALLEDKLPQIIKVLEEKTLDAKQMKEMFELDITPNLLARRLKDIPAVSWTTKNKNLYFYVGREREFEQTSFL